VGHGDPDTGTDDLEVVDLETLFSDARLRPRAPGPAPAGPIGDAQTPRRRRRWLPAAAVLLVVAVLVAVAAVSPESDSTAEPTPSTLDIGEAPPATAHAGRDALAFGATLLVLSADGLAQVDLETGERAPIDAPRFGGLPEGLDLVGHADGSALLRDAQGGWYAFHWPDRELVPLPPGDAALTSQGSILVVAPGAQVRSDPGDAAPARVLDEPAVPDGRTVVAGLDDAYLLREPGGALVAWTSGDAVARPLPGEWPVVLDAVGNRYAWVERACQGRCLVSVSDLDDQMTVAVDPGRPVAALAVDPSGGYLGLVARDGRVALVDVIGEPGDVEWLTLGAAAAPTITWRPDGNAAFVVVDDPPRVLAIETAGRATTELELDTLPQAIAWVGPSSRGGPRQGRDVLPALRGDRFPLLAGRPSGVELLIDDPGAGEVAVLDLDTGAARALPARTEGPAGRALAWGAYGVPGGWLVLGDDGVLWYPHGANGDDPQVVLSSRRGGEVRGDAARGEVLLTEYRGMGLRIRWFDPATGEVTDPVDVYVEVVGTAGGGVILQAPPEVAAAPQGAVSLSLETGEQRAIPPPEPGMWPWTAAGDRIVWGAARCRVGTPCRVVVTDASGATVHGEIRRANQHLRPVVSPDGRYVALGSGRSGGEVAVLDLASGALLRARLDRPLGWQAWWSASGWFVTTDGDGVPVLLAPGETTFRTLPGLRGVQVLGVR
jgi:hypothetical protein